MSKQPTRRRVALTLAVAALVGIVGAGQALAGAAAPDERVLERQGTIDRHRAPGQLDEQGKLALPPRLASEDRPPRRFIRPEPPVGTGPRVGDQQVAPDPVGTDPEGGRGDLVVVAVVAALLAAVGTATTWRARHRRPQPESTS
jgi:hypothetical protein